MNRFFAGAEKKYINRIIALLLIFTMVFGLCGCGLVPSLDLTEEQQKIIAEYSAGLLLKYDKHYNGSLKAQTEETDDGVQVIEEEPDFPDADENEDFPSDSDIQMPDPEFSEDLTANEQSVDSDVQYTDVSIADALGIADFDIIYKSYEAHNIYPEEESDDLVFSLQAQNGMELLVVNFGITNNTDKRSKCNVIDSDSSFRLLINDSERVNSYKTILLNDLSSYSDEIEGYGMANAVLVFEVAAGTTDNIQKIDLIIKNDNGSTTHKLR